MALSIPRLFKRKESVKASTVKVKAFLPPPGHYADWELKGDHFELPPELIEVLSNFKMHVARLENMREHYLLSTGQITIKIKPEAEI